MMLRLALRLVAIAIAIAGVADPVWTVTRRAPRALTITVLETPTLALPDGATTRRERADTAANRLQTALRDSFDVRIRTERTTTNANPCAPDAACIVISDGARPRRLGSGRFLGGVRVGATLTPNLTIRSLGAPVRTDPSASTAIDVELAAKGIRESATTLRVFDGDALVGQGSHTWPPDPNSDRTATARVEWTPIGTGLRHIRVVASPAANEVTQLDNDAHTAVDVASEIHDVLLYEPQPTWSGTFVRRALEHDARVRVRARVRVGTAVDISTGDAPLDSAILERTNTRVVLVTTAEGLSANEVATLEQFMRLRGGSVVLMLDRVPSGAIRRLLPFVVAEHHANQPTRIGPLMASEFLTFAPPDVVTTVLAAAARGPALVSRPIGNGRIVVSGVIDAWRFRHENGAFAKFWQATVADAAAAAGDVLTVNATKRVAQPGERVQIDVEWRPLRVVQDAIEAQASMTCGSVARPVRLWPAGAPGRFEGEAIAPAPGRCRIDAAVNNSTASTPLLVRAAPSGLDSPADELSTAVSAHGGTVVHAGDEHELVTRLRQSASPSYVSSPVHPLRSPWWMLPFASCLGGEWWLRRRKGLR